MNRSPEQRLNYHIIHYMFFYLLPVTLFPQFNELKNMLALHTSMLKKMVCFIFLLHYVNYRYIIQPLGLDS